MRVKKPSGLVIHLLYILVLESSIGIACSNQWTIHNASHLHAELVRWQTVVEVVMLGRSIDDKCIAHLIFGSMLKCLYM